jgi:hypothetical protein
VVDSLGFDHSSEICLGRCLWLCRNEALHTRLGAEVRKTTTTDLPSPSQTHYTMSGSCVYLKIVRKVKKSRSGEFSCIVSEAGRERRWVLQDVAQRYGSQSAGVICKDPSLAAIFQRQPDTPPCCDGKSCTVHPALRESSRQYPTMELDQCFGWSALRLLSG